ncbi:sugar phosphate isomerase/epimerase [candidate division KSB1 bacterium]|nr:sugar phosphate isomerase/epimerase [candidate division KSB1 bacterium]
MTDNFSNILNHLSYHVVYDPNLHDAIDYAASHGFHGIQIAIEVPRFSPERYSGNNRQAIRQHAEKTGVRIALHGPDDAASLFVSHPALVRGMHEYYRDVFKFGVDIGASLITIHIGQPAAFGRHAESPSEKIPYDDRPHYEAQLRKNLQWLCIECPENIILCVENYKLNDMILNVIDRFLESNQLFLCWDLAKNFDKDMNKNEVIESYFSERIGYIRQCHLHDIVPGFRSHQVIGSGDIDFYDYLQTLQHHPVLDYCIEVRPREMAFESLQNLNQMCQMYHEQMQQWRNIGVRETDTEIDAINLFERSNLRNHEFDNLKRAIRRNITYLECTHYLFFENIQKIIENIGKLQIKEQIYGCMIIEENRMKRIRDFEKCLHLWLDRASPENFQSDFCRQVFASLGKSNERKILLVRRLARRLNFILAWTSNQNSTDRSAAIADKFVDFDDLQEPETMDLKRMISHQFPDASEFEQHICENRPCHHKFFRHLDIIIKNIGAESWDRSKPARHRDGIERAAITQKYIDHLTSWLNRDPVNEETSQIFHALDKMDPVKEWLVMSLKKTLEVFVKNMRNIGEVSEQETR